MFESRLIALNWNSTRAMCDERRPNRYNKARKQGSIADAI